MAAALASPHIWLMPLPHHRDPWGQGEEPARASRAGWLVWLVLALGLTGLIWFLATRFSYALTSRDDWIGLTRLVAILALVSSSVLFVRRFNIGEAVRNIAIWVGIGAVVLLGYSFRAEITDVGERLRSELLPHEATEVAAGVLRISAGGDGQFHVVADVNGVPVRFLIDTGAHDIVLTRRDARRAGFEPDRLRFTQVYETANGFGRGAPIRLDSIGIGPNAFFDMPASVNDADMSSSLLGVTFLGRLESYEVRGDTMLLRW